MLCIQLLGNTQNCGMRQRFVPNWSKINNKPTSTLCSRWQPEEITYGWSHKLFLFFFLLNPKIMVFFQLKKNKKKTDCNLYCKCIVTSGSMTLLFIIAVISSTDCLVSALCSFIAARQTKYQSNWCVWACTHAFVFCKLRDKLFGSHSLCHTSFRSDR